MLSGNLMVFFTWCQKVCKSQLDFKDESQWIDLNPNG